MARPIPAIDFDGTPLRDVLQELGAAAGTKIVLHEPQLEIMGVELSTRIHLRLRDVELSDALERLIVNSHVDYLPDEGANELQITAGKPPASVMKVYDVHDLVERWMASPLLVRPREPSAPRRIGGGWVLLPSTTLPTTAPLAAPDEQELMHDITELIVALTDKSQIQYFGPGQGVIEPIGSRIVVSGPPALHRKVEQMLRRLRESVGQEEGNPP